MKVRITFERDKGNPITLDDDDRLCRLLVEAHGGGLTEKQTRNAMADFGRVCSGEAVSLPGKHLGKITIQKEVE